MEPFIAEIRIFAINFETNASRARGDTTLGDVVVVKTLDASTA